MNKMILGIIGSVIILPVYSQHYIKGIIIDSENAVMPMVNVAFLSQADSTLPIIPKIILFIIQT